MTPDTIPELGRPELLEFAESIARERLIETDIVVGAMEQAVQAAALRKYGQDLEIQAEIDRESGAITLQRILEVADPVEDRAKQISLEEGRARDPEATVGQRFLDPLPPIDVGRLSAQTAKQVVYQKVREAERKRQYEEFKDRVGEIVNGIVKRFEYGNVIVDLARAEGFMRRDQTLAKESYRPGDRIRSYILDVREEAKGPQILLSRACNEFLVKLFAQEVPEIYDGTVEIRSAARDPGSRAKIAVLSNDPSIDPVGACVGMRGSRVQAVVGELQGERIDIIQWSPDTATFIVNALAPAEVTRVVLDEEANQVEAVVPEDKLSIAIGRRGQNVRLASKLTGWDIDIVTEAVASERRQEELRRCIRMFVQTLDVDEVVAHLLVTEGFDSLEAVAFVPLEELVEIEGLREEVAEELRARANQVLAECDAKLIEVRRRLGVEDDVAAIEGLTVAMLVVLGLNAVRTKDDLADLATDELTELLQDKAALEKLRVFLQANDEIMNPGMQLTDVNLSEEEAGAIVMAARAHWFEDGEAMAAAARERVEREKEKELEAAAEAEADPLAAASAAPEEAAGAEDSGAADGPAPAGGEAEEASAAQAEAAPGGEPGPGPEATAPDGSAEDSGAADGSAPAGVEAEDASAAPAETASGSEPGSGPAAGGEAPMEPEKEGGPPPAAAEEADAPADRTPAAADAENGGPVDRGPAGGGTGA